MAVQNFLGQESIRSRSFHDRQPTDENDCEQDGCRHGDPLPKELRNYLHEWATVTVPVRWEGHCNSHSDGGPWLDSNEFNSFARFVRDYLLTENVFNGLTGRLAPVVNLKTPVTYPVDGVSHFDLLRDNLRMTGLHLRLACGFVLRLPMLLARRLAASFAPRSDAERI